MSAPSRNGPCHCGSGVKYKKCCLPRDEAARVAAPPAPRLVNHRGRLLTVSDNPSAESLDLAAEHFDSKDAGEGFAAQLMRFSQPLIEAADGETEKIEKAMMLGMVFWNLAIANGGGEDLLDVTLERIAKTEAEAQELRKLAASMGERHRQMFPALHARRRQ
jgi:SEC-C motif